ncbi:MAG: hypothetical protein IJD42_07055 [Clostridia bacterium]|nr:hypothetical protein [Clostridia bacterium]
MNAGRLFLSKEFYITEEFTNVRRTEKIDTRTTPLGAGTNAKSSKGAQGKNEAAHTRRRDIGESISADCHDEP